MLRGFELRCGGEVVELSLNSQRVIAFLALHDRPLLRAYVAGTLWGDTSDDRAGASLRTALWRLNRNGRRLTVASSGPQVRLAPEAQVDLHDTVGHVRGLLDDPAAAATDALARLSLSEDVLPDWYDDWVCIPRERFRQFRLHALEAICTRLAAAGRFGDAVDAGLAAVSGEPLRESAHRTLIRVYLAEGNLGEAMRQFQVCRELLRKELSIEPSSQLLDLMRCCAGHRGDGPMARAVTVG